jgi:putative resolvase
MESKKSLVCKSGVKKKEKQFVTVGEASLLTGLDSQTIRKLADNNTIYCYRTPAEQRRINLKSLEQFCANRASSYSKELPAANCGTERNNYIYARVNSKNMKDLIERQINIARTYSEYGKYKVVSDISSGNNFDRKGIYAIIQDCLCGNIGTVVVAHADVLSRLAYDFFEQIFKKGGGTLVNLNLKEFQDTEEKVTEDIIEIIKMLKGYNRPSKKKKKSTIDSTAEKPVSYAISEPKNSDSAAILPADE